MPGRIFRPVRPLVLIYNSMVPIYDPTFKDNQFYSVKSTCLLTSSLARFGWAQYGHSDGNYRFRRRLFHVLQWVHDEVFPCLRVADEVHMLTVYGREGWVAWALHRLDAVP